ncbi:PREDICTED: uncharacterized protein LOC104812429 isoform X2 [Tarenaya hassleriana]|uniref:uncharacterized protein LOC104812429 isoform X2 n=1 Tax=Tarenaya hassleriana TaxID=28532 RepID=UPI00053C456C|nr:PREDICTED: uncharacterized protein LOC104812429 isoform X2 [Tarenaya hassleriana]
MGSFGAESELAQTLVEAGNSLLNPPPSTDGLLTLLDEIESLLSNVEQDPPISMQDALLPSMKALISVDLLRHPDPDVRVSVVSCLTEITRITAPEAPYDDDQMKEIFKLTVEAFGKLADVSCRAYKKAELILDTVSKVRSCLVMLDLECDKLILEMFQELLKIISPDHPQAVLLAIDMIMITVIDESEEVSTDLLNVLLACVRKENKNISPTSWKLVENVLSRCACKIKPYIVEAMKSPGNSLDLYSSVVSSICQSESGIAKERKIVNAKENEADEKRSTRQAIPSDSLEETLNLGLSRKRIRSGNISRRIDDSSKQANEVDKRSREVKRSSKKVQPKSTDDETESVRTLKRKVRKPNSLLNREEGYDHSWVSGGRGSVKAASSKKLRKKGRGGSSLGNPDAKNTPFAEESTSLPSKAGQTTQSVVISLPSPYGIVRGPRKRSRVKTEEIDQDSSLSSPTAKKETSTTQAKKKSSLHASMKTEPCDEEYLVMSNHENFEKAEVGRKAVKSGRKAVLQNCLKEKAMKKPLTGAKKVKTSGKGLVIQSGAKEKGKEGSTSDGVIPRSSKSKNLQKMVSHIATRPSGEGSEESPKTHPKRKRTARKEVDAEMSGLGAELVGKRIKVWWPLDKTFYEGVINSYDDQQKKHLVLYADGENEMLNLEEERWEFIEDSTPAEEDQETDLPEESMTLSGILRRQKAHKNKNGPTPSSSETRSSKRTLKKEDDEMEFEKQSKRVKGKAFKKPVSELKPEIEEPENREGKTLKSLKELNAEPHQAEVSDGQKPEAQEPTTKREVNGKSLRDPNEESITEEENPESVEEPNEGTETDGKEPNGDGTEAMTEAEKQEETCKSMSEDGKQESGGGGNDPECEKKQNAEPREVEGVTSSHLSDH